MMSPFLFSSVNTTEPSAHLNAFTGLKHAIHSYNLHPPRIGPAATFGAFVRLTFLLNWCAELFLFTLILLPIFLLLNS